MRFQKIGLTTVVLCTVGIQQVLNWRLQRKHCQTIFLL